MSEALISEDAPFAKFDHASVLLSAQVTHYDSTMAISHVSLRGGIIMYVPRQLEVGRNVTLRVLATDISLTLHQPQQTSILNILEGVVSKVVDDACHHITLLVNVKGHNILARLSRKSFYDLKLDIGSAVYVQLKAVSIHDF